MIPTVSLRNLTADATAAELLAATAETGFSRFPITSKGTPIGYLHVRDILELPADQLETTRLGDLRLRRLPLVAADAAAASVVEILRTQGSHLAEVIRNDGSAVGIIALEDALEELIGEVRDTAHR